MSIQSRQPRGVPVGGQFAAMSHNESDVSLTSVTDSPDYSSWDAVDIDGVLARLHGEHAVAMSRWSSQMDHLSGEVARSQGKGWQARASRADVDAAIEAAHAKIAAGDGTYVEKGLIDHFERAEAYRTEADRAEAEMAPFNAEFNARGGWTRAFLVVGTGQGHVHSSMDCSTCFYTGYDGAGNWRQGTQFHWVTDMSDKSEDEIIKAAGTRACTVCYPNAPVEDLNRPTSLYTPDEVQKARDREERANAKIARDAKKIASGLTADGSEFEVNWDEFGGGHERDPQTGASTFVRKSRSKRERFKTERAAVQWAVQYMAWNQDDASRLAEKQPAFDAIIEAVAAKHDRSVDDVRAELAKKVIAKRKRDGWDD